jgi:hypothetical protein
VPNGSTGLVALAVESTPEDGVLVGGRSAAGGDGCASSVAPAPPAPALLVPFVLFADSSYPAWINALIALGVLGGMLTLFVVRRRRTARESSAPKPPAGPARGGAAGRL